MAQKSTSLRPALTLTEKIQIILNSCMPNRDKIDCMQVLLQGEIEEKNICLNKQKIKQQIMSELLYLCEKIEKDEQRKNDKNWIWKRINLCWRNCIKSGWLLPQEQRYEGCDYLENLRGDKVVEKIETKKMKRNTGWSRKTQARYERFYLGVGVATKKKRQPQRQRLLPLSDLTPNKEVDDVRYPFRSFRFRRSLGRGSANLHSKSQYVIC